jgi:hypothetical protein
MLAIKSFGSAWVGGGAVAAVGRLHEDKIRISKREKETIFFTANLTNLIIFYLSIAENSPMRSRFIV